MQHEHLLRHIYKAFNQKDIETVLGALQEDVDWPNIMEAKRAIGHAEVRDYWQRQFEVVNPHVEPKSFETDSENRIVVTVHQVVKDLAGSVLFDGNVRHIYTFRDGLVSRMDVETIQ